MGYPMLPADALAAAPSSDGRVFGQAWGQQLNLPVISRPKIGAALPC
jgi:hypothetical protein